MDIAQEQKLYYEARLKECQTRPDLNLHQIAEYEKILDKFNSSASFDEFSAWMEQTQAYFQLSKAEQIDRYSNFIKTQQFYNDKKREEVFRMKLETVMQSTDAFDMNTRLSEIDTKTNPIELAARNSIHELSNLFMHIISYITAPGSKKEKTLTDVKETWAKLKSTDPEISVGKILSYPPYRYVIIFEDERIIKLLNAVKEVVS